MTNGIRRSKKKIIIITTIIIIKVQLPSYRAKSRALFYYPCMTCFVKKPITFEDFPLLFAGKRKLA